jgi:hypothetical protein
MKWKTKFPTTENRIGLSANYQAVQKGETFESVSLGHIRSHGCRDLLVYCNSGRCHHGVTMNADHMPDDTPIRPLGSRMVCTRCGHVGADVRPGLGTTRQQAARLIDQSDSLSEPPRDVESTARAARLVLHLEQVSKPQDFEAAFVAIAQERPRGLLVSWKRVLREAGYFRLWQFALLSARRLRQGADTQPQMLPSFRPQIAKSPRPPSKPRQFGQAPARQIFSVAIEGSIIP